MFWKFRLEVTASIVKVILYGQRDVSGLLFANTYNMLRKNNADQFKKATLSVNVSSKLIFSAVHFEIFKQNNWTVNAVDTSFIGTSFIISVTIFNSIVIIRNEHSIWKNEEETFTSKKLAVLPFLFKKVSKHFLIFWVPRAIST